MLMFVQVLRILSDKIINEKKSKISTDCLTMYEVLFWLKASSANNHFMFFQNFRIVINHGFNLLSPASLNLKPLN